MNHRNVLELVGEISFAPKVRHTKGGTAVTNLAIKCRREVNGKTFTDYLDVTCWGKEAEAAGELSVGDVVEIWGRVGKRSYEKDGNKVYVVDITATSLRRATDGYEPMDDDPMPF